MSSLIAKTMNKSRVDIPPSPKRITITIPHCTYNEILQRSIAEGRSMSNLASFLLQQGVSDSSHQPWATKRTAQPDKLDDDELA